MIRLIPLSHIYIYIYIFAFLWRIMCQSISNMPNVKCCAGLKLKQTHFWLQLVMKGVGLVRCELWVSTMSCLNCCLCQDWIHAGFFMNNSGRANFTNCPHNNFLVRVVSNKMVPQQLMNFYWVALEVQFGSRIQICCSRELTDFSQNVWIKPDTTV